MIDSPRGEIHVDTAALQTTQCANNDKKEPCEAGTD